MSIDVGPVQRLCKIDEVPAFLDTIALNPESVSKYIVPVLRTI